MTTQEENLSIKEVFVQCQKKVQSHPRLLKEMLNNFKDMPLKEFFKSFCKLLTLILRVPEPNSFAQNSLDFVVSFTLAVQDSAYPPEICSQEEENLTLFTIKLFEFLFDLHNAEEQTIRYRSCQLISLLLCSLNNDLNIDDDIFDKLQTTLLASLKDRVAGIRILAIGGLRRLQDPSDKDCPIVKALLFHLSHDPNPLVRQRILSSLGPSVTTLFQVVKRTRDVKETVRRDAYLYLANRVHVKVLTISQRNRLLTEGLTDRAEMVQNEVKNQLLPSWINVCAGDICVFLKFLDIQGKNEAAKLSLKTLFEEVKPEELADSFTILNEEKLISYSELTIEKSFYWQSIVRYFKDLNNAEGEECLDSIMTDVIAFCNYMKTYIMRFDSNWELNKQLEHELISIHLLSIASNYEFADIASSQCVEKTITNLFLSPNLCTGIIEPLVSCMVKLYQDPHKLIETLADIISDIREPITLQEVLKTEDERKQIEIDIAKLSVELNILRDELEEEINNQAFTKAQITKENISALEAKKIEHEKLFLPCSQEVRIEKSDHQTILKCLMIVTQSLLQVDLQIVSPTLRSIIETLILPGIHSEDPAVRIQAVHSLGLCCIIDRNVACEHIVLLIQISQIDQEAIQVMALKSIYDLLLFYGLEPFICEEAADKPIVGDIIPETPSGGSEKRERATNIMSVLKAQLDSQISDVRTITAKGLAKLMIMGRFYSPQILSNLIIMWFNPANEDNVLLTHFLGLFLPNFAGSGKDAKHCLEEALIPSLMTILDAPKSSPLSQVEPLNMGKFLLQLLATNTDLNAESANISESNFHDRLGEKILNVICKDSISVSTRIWCTLLVFLQISPTCVPIHKEMAILSGRLLKMVRDKSSLNYLQRFHETLKNKVLLNTGSQSSTENVEIEDVDSLDTCSDSDNSSLNFEVSCLTKKTHRRNLKKLPVPFETDISVIGSQASQSVSFDTPNIPLKNIRLDFGTEDSMADSKSSQDVTPDECKRITRSSQISNRKR